MDIGQQVSALDMLEMPMVRIISDTMTSVRLVANIFVSP